MNKTNFLKTAGVFLIGVLILPQVTFAAWWNPFSWFKNLGLFSNKVDTTQVIDIQTEDVNAPTEKTSSPEETEIVVPKPTQPQPQVQRVNTAVPIVPQNQSTITPIATPAKDYRKIYDDLRADYTATRSKVIETRDQYNDKATTAYEKEYVYYLNQLVKVLNEDIRYLADLSATASDFGSQVDAYVLKHKKAVDEFDFRTETYQQELRKYEEEKRIADSQKTTIEIGEVDRSWGGSDYRYTLKFSINGTWTSGYIDIKAVRVNGTANNTRTQIFKSDLEKNGGSYIGTRSAVCGSSTASYEIRLYSEQPYYSSGRGPFFVASSLLTEEVGKITLPGC